MTFPTADMWIKSGTERFRAVGFYLYLLFQERKGPHQAGFQDHMRAGICHQDFWDWASKA